MFFPFKKMYFFVMALFLGGLLGAQMMCASSVHQSDPVIEIVTKGDVFIGGVSIGAAFFSQDKDSDVIENNADFLRTLWLSLRSSDLIIKALFLTNLELLKQALKTSDVNQILPFKVAVREDEGYEATICSGESTYLEIALRKYALSNNSERIKLLPLITELLDNGANPNAKVYTQYAFSTPVGEYPHEWTGTVMFDGVDTNDTNLVELLLKHGGNAYVAETSLHTLYGYTRIVVKNPEMVQLIKAHLTPEQRREEEQDEAELEETRNYLEAMRD